jgi:hypothetical protein
MLNLHSFYMIIWDRKDLPAFEIGCAAGRNHSMLLETAIIDWKNKIEKLKIMKNNETITKTLFFLYFQISKKNKLK